MKKLLLTLTTLSMLLVFALPVYAATAEDYPYIIPVTITNNSGAAIDTQVCVSINSGQLISGGFLDTGATQAAGFDSLGAEIDIGRQDITNDAGCWWVDTGPLPNGQVATQTIRTGTDSPANPPAPLEFTSGYKLHSTEYACVTSYIGASGQDKVTMELNDFETSAFPSWGTTHLFYMGNQSYTYDHPYAITLNNSGQLGWWVIYRINGSGSYSYKHFIYPTPINLNQKYDIRMSFQRHSNTYLYYYIYLDNVVVHSGYYPGGGSWLNFGRQTYQGNSWGGATLYSSMNTMKVARARIYSSNTPSEANTRLDWGFSPATASLTQVGTAGNYWAWTQGYLNNPDINNGCVMTGVGNPFTRNLTGITYDVGALEDSSPSSSAQISYSPADMIGALPGLTVVNPGSTFTGDDALVAVIESTGLTSDGGLFGFLVLIAAVLGAFVVAVTKQPILGVGILGVAVGIGGVIGWFSFLYVVLGLVMCFGIAGSAALLGKK